MTAAQFTDLGIAGGGIVAVFAALFAIRFGFRRDKNLEDA